MKPKKQNILHKIKVIWCITLIVTASLTTLFLTNTARAMFTNIAKNAPITGQSIGDDLWEVNDGDRNTYAYTGIANADSVATVSLNMPEGCNTSYLYWKIQLWVMPGTGPNPAHLDIYGDSGWQTIRYYSTVYLGQTIAEIVQYQGHISAARIWASKGTHWLFQNRWNFYELEVWANILLLIANFSWSPQYPQPTDTITFDASTSYDPDGNIVLYEWDWNNDGYYENATSSPAITHSWSDIGPHQITLKVTDNNGTTNTTTKTITVGYLSNGFFYYWTYPSAGLLERQMGNSYTITLYAMNTANSPTIFNHGLGYDFTCKNAYGNPMTNPDFLNEYSTCEVYMSPNPQTYSYLLGSQDDTLMNQGEWYSWDLKVIPHWQWIEPWSADRVPKIILELGADIIIELSGIDVGGADYNNTIGEIENAYGATPWSLEYNYEGIADSSPNSQGTVRVWVPPLKIALLIASLAQGVLATPLTLTGLGLLTGILTAPLAPPFFAAEAALWISSEISYYAAADPDNNYTIIAQPEPVNIPALAEIPPGPAKNITETAFKYLSYTQAWNKSICRYYGALDNSSMEWALIQLSNAKYYAQKQFILAQSLHAQLENISSTLPPITNDDIDKIKQNLSENGLPAFDQLVLTQLGYNSEQINNLSNYYINLNDSIYLNYIDLLKNSSKVLANTTVSALMNESPELLNNSLNTYCAIEPNSIETTNPPNNVSVYIEFQNISNLTNYHINSAALNNCIKPISIASSPGDYNNNGVDDFKIDFNTNDILNLSNEGEIMLSIFGNVTTPSGNNSFFSGSSGVLIYGLPPNIPTVPTGPIQGVINETYTYSTSTSDPENSLVYYLYNWGDNSTSGWVGPYTSQEDAMASHSWNRSGIYHIKVKARDYYGQESNWSSPFNITMSDVPPQITNVQAIPSIQTGGGNVNISASVTDNMQVNKVCLIIQNPNSTIENISISQNKTGNTYYCNRTYNQGLVYSYYIWTNDNNGNANYSMTNTFLINNPPFTPSNPNPIDGGTNTSLNTILSWSGGDFDIGDSVIYDVYFGTTSPPPKVVSNQTNTTYRPGTLEYSRIYYWKIVSWDTQGVSTGGPIWHFTTILDTTPPVTTISFNGTIGNNGWYISPVFISFNATDSQSGVTSMYYNIDNGGWTTYSAPLVISPDGNHSISYYSIDKVGNIESPKNATLKIDQTAPMITLTVSALNILKTKWLLIANTNDAISSINRVEFYVDNFLQGTVSYPGPYQWNYNGSGKVVYAIAYDNAGNSERSPDVNCQDLQLQSSNELLYANQYPILLKRGNLL